MKKIETAKELIHILGANLSTLNYDFYKDREMPPIIPGEKGVRHFTETLRERGFTNLAEAVVVVHRGELRRRKGKNFPNVAEARQFQAYSEILRDLSIGVTQNISLLDVGAHVRKIGDYAVGVKIGSILISLYDGIFASVKRGYEIAGKDNFRIETLSGQSGLELSPLLKSMQPAAVVGAA
ncbi:MAG: hypothetical protein Q7R82_00850 [Candidatus Daviesbacteria bacterium]|nr:hypothetical protein [Candidatus Daviesbacteria bacterium]